jgi:hypothetical protein
MFDNLNPTRWERCQSCSTAFIRQTGRRKKFCEDCRMAKVMAIAAQVHGKEGLYWENTIRGQLRKWMREAKLLGIDVSEEVGA